MCVCVCGCYDLTARPENWISVWFKTEFVYF